MKRSMLVLVMLTAAITLAHATAISARAQCGFDKKTKEAIPCGPGEKERKAKPTAVPPTATFTLTPEPTATSTPKPTQTKTAVPTASLTAVAAVVAPPPPTPSAPNCPPSPSALLAGIALLGAGGLGSYLSRVRGRGGEAQWLTQRGAQGEGVLPASYRSYPITTGGQSPGEGVGEGGENAFDYEHSEGQQRLLNTAFGNASGRANDRLQNAGPTTRGWASIASLMALLSGAAALAASGLGAAGLVSCGAVLPAALGGALLGLAASLLLQPGRPPSGGVSMDGSLELPPPFEYNHEDVRVTLHSGGTLATKNSSQHPGGGPVATKTPNRHLTGDPLDQGSFRPSDAPGASEGGGEEASTKAGDTDSKD